MDALWHKPLCDGGALWHEPLLSRRALWCKPLYYGSTLLYALWGISTVLGDFVPIKEGGAGVGERPTGFLGGGW
jgi:hypothetical protein